MNAPTTQADTRDLHWFWLWRMLADRCSGLALRSGEPDVRRRYGLRAQRARARATEAFYRWSMGGAR